ncbi:MAG: protein kinase [Planctomycetota bacterium]|jgi:tetratricopeptide (TPR) repeat protein/predicted Ser/Thr protein kinase|nr:protein kinase [Planctomycetota bacterium]
MSEEGGINCPLCGCGFNSGAMADRVHAYCPSCGKRFRPGLSGDETALLPPPPPADAPEPGVSGRSFGDYDILEEIARGGMGVVYRARQRALRRVVALKLLRSGENASLEERERLLREAKAAAGLSHPNIVPIHEFSMHQGQPYFTMDFIEGQPLDRLLEKGPMNVREAVGIIEEVARAIDFAHSHGVIHRDLKPGNIIIGSSGRPMITDFGLAVELTDDGKRRERMTAAGAIMGTIPYAPPEQAAGRVDQIGGHSDVYAMGAVLYEMVSGQPPFSGFNQFELMRRVVNQEPAPPRRHNPKLSRDVETIILKCLEKDPRRRYPSAQAFADDCRSFLRGEVIAARPATLGYRCLRLFRRRPLSTFLAASVMAMSIALWFGADHIQVMAKEKEETERELLNSRARIEHIAMEKEEADRRSRREWRTAYNLNFDYFFRWDGNPARARQEEIPWMDRARARLLAQPPRLALTGQAGAGGGLAPNIGFPFVLPHEARIVIHFQTPYDNLGELLLLLDVNRDFESRPDSIALSLGPPGRPGAILRRGEVVIGENPAFSLRPGISAELTIERSDQRLTAYIDGEPILQADDPLPLLAADADGRLALSVRDGSLDFIDLSLESRGMSHNLAVGLIEIANNLAARGRPDLALRLYANVLMDPADPAGYLRTLRAYARLLWIALPAGERNFAGIKKACDDLYRQMSADRMRPGESDYLIGLALANQSGQKEERAALEQLERAAATAYAAGNGEYGDLARLEALFVRLRLGMPEEAARRFGVMLDDGAADRLQQRFGSELGAGGRAALILEKAEPMIQAKGDLKLVADLLRLAAAISPTSRECAAGFRGLAMVRIEGGNVDLGLELLRQAERVAPDWPRPYLDEAGLLYRLDRPAEAEEVLSRADSALPPSLDYRLGQARLYLGDIPEKYRDPARAEQAARAAIELSQGKNPATLELLAAAMEKQGRLNEARSAILAALTLEKTDARIKWHDRLNQYRPETTIDSGAAARP